MPDQHAPSAPARAVEHPLIPVASDTSGAILPVRELELRHKLKELATLLHRLTDNADGYDSSLLRAAAHGCVNAGMHGLAIEMQGYDLKGRLLVREAFEMLGQRAD